MRTEKSAFLRWDEGFLRGGFFRWTGRAEAFACGDGWVPGRACMLIGRSSVVAEGVEEKECEVESGNVGLMCIGRDKD